MSLNATTIFAMSSPDAEGTRANGTHPPEGYTPAVLLTTFNTMRPFDSLQDKLILFFFSLIVAVSFCGNLLVCRTLLRQRPLCSNSTKVLIGVLALSDLNVTVFCIPFTIVDIILKDWIFGEFFCTLVSFVQANSVYVSSFTMAVIAINRWNAIYKFQPKSSERRSSAAVAATKQPSVSNEETAAGGSATSMVKRHTLVSQGSLKRQDGKRCCCTSLCPFLNFAGHRHNARRESSVNIELDSVESNVAIQPQSQNAVDVSAGRLSNNNNNNNTNGGSSGGGGVGHHRCRLKARTRLVLTVLSIWFIAALHSLPHTVYNQVKTIPSINIIEGETNHEGDVSGGGLASGGDRQSFPLRRRCVTIPPEAFAEHFGLFLTLFTTLTQYFIPLSCAGAIYTRIGFTIIAQGRVGEMSSTKVKQLSQKKRRRLLMLVLIVAIFALCWLPFNVYYLLRDFGVTEGSNYHAFLVCLWLAMSSVCYNPFVYCWLNEDFQREAKLVLNCFRRLCTRH